MAEEVIKLFEYFVNSPVIRGVAIMSLAFGIAIFAVSIAVFVFVFRQMTHGSKHKKDWW